MAQIAQEDTGKEPPTVQGRESPQSRGSSENIWVGLRYAGAGNSAEWYHCL